MAYSAATYKGDGSQSTYMIPFDYLQKDFVKVTINEVDKVYAQDYNVDGRELSFPTAPPSGSIIKIYRETPTDRMVKWNEGSVLTSSNMTTQQIQELHLIEETTYNLENSAMVKTEDNHKWEGKYLPITHVGDPTDDSDVVNLGTIKKEETGFLASVRSQLDTWLATLGTTYNNYSKSLKKSFDSHTSSLKNQFNTYTASLLNDFNTYKDTLKTNYDSYASTLLSKYNEYLASLTATKDAVKDSEDKAKTSEVNAKASEVAAAESAKQAAHGQINADWNETNANSKAFIKNKPDVPTKADVANSVTTKALTVTGKTSVPTANAGNSSKAIANTAYVQGELTNYLPLSGGTLTGVVNGVTPTAGDNSTKIATTAFVRTIVPAGVVLAYARGAVPTGWLLCDGSAVSRTDYAALFAVIGTTYGAGNGSTTFNLPNLVDKFVEGSATAGTVKSAGLPNITGNLGPIRYMKETVTGSGALFSATGGSTVITPGGGSGSTPHNTIDFDASRSSAIYGKSNTVQPPALTMRYIIKY